MAVAKEIHKTNIRNARTPKLAELDIEFQKAQETSADTSWNVGTQSEFSGFLVG